MPEVTLPTPAGRTASPARAYIYPGTLTFSSAFCSRGRVLDLQQLVVPPHRLGVDLGLRVERQRVPQLVFRHAETEREIRTVRVLVELTPGLERQVSYLVQDRGAAPDRFHALDFEDIRDLPTECHARKDVPVRV